MRVRIGVNDPVVIKLENCSEEDESQRRAQICPGPWQQHGGDHEDQRVEKIQRAFDTARQVDDQCHHGQIGEHLQQPLQAMFGPDRNQKQEKQREHEPQHHPRQKGHDRHRAGREADDGQLNGKQDQQDQDANLHQPCQPVSLIGDGMHGVRRSSLAVRRSNSKRRLFYPANFEIMANSGMYREITMPPMEMPNMPMMTGSSMANMSLVAASTSSS